MPVATHRPTPASPAARSRRALWGMLFGSVGKRMQRAAARPGGAFTISNETAHRIVREGMSGQVLVHLGELLGLGTPQFAPVLGVDRATARRYVQNDQQLPIHSAETVLRLAEMEALAADVFTSDEAAHGWLKTPHPLLGETPIDAASTSYGAQRVREILTAIKYGGVA
jgi:putative toxin-antitoxin system antitoxin component (TIGR02293 family)